jgi:basic membrane protein A
VDAAAQRGVYAIGVDTDQYYTLPEAAPRLLSSAMKPETEPVAAIIKLTKEGNFPTGGSYMGPSGYAPYHDLAKDVPANVDAEMQALLKGILDGTIKTNVPPMKPAQ